MFPPTAASPWGWRLLLAVAFLAFFTAFAEAQPAATPQKWALLIGVDHYNDSGHINDLSSAGRDVEGLKAALIEAGGVPEANITLLTTEGDAARQPTRGNILRELAALGRRVQPGDNGIRLFFRSWPWRSGANRICCPAMRTPWTKRRLATPVSRRKSFRDRLKQVPGGPADRRL